MVYYYIHFDYHPLTTSVMFSWLFGTNKDEATIIEHVFYYTMHNSEIHAMKLIKQHELDLNNKKCKDKYGNTLLHIVARSDNINFARQLILYGLRKDHVNVFNEVAVDIAFNYNNITMIKILTDIVQDRELLNRITALEANKITLLQTLEQSEKTLIGAQEEIKTLKRKRCDNCEVNVRECKRLKTQNDELVKTTEQLTKDNSELKTTTENLRGAFKNKSP